MTAGSAPIPLGKPEPRERLGGVEDHAAVGAGQRGERRAGLGLRQQALRQLRRLGHPHGIGRLGAHAIQNLRQLRNARLAPLLQPGHHPAVGELHRRAHRAGSGLEGERLQLGGAAHSGDEAGLAERLRLPHREPHLAGDLLEGARPHLLAELGDGVPDLAIGVTGRAQRQEDVGELHLVPGRVGLAVEHLDHVHARRPAEHSADLSHGRGRRRRRALPGRRSGRP